MSKKIALSLLAGALIGLLAGYESADALNPQPLPPMKHPVTSAMVVHSRTPGAHRLNPQPLPPG